MGLDAIIYITGDMTEDMNTPFIVTHERHDDGSLSVTAASAGSWAFALDRYYSGAYPRGVWPDIYALIRVCKSVWPKGIVWYTDDHAESYGESPEECTDKFLSAMWSTWLTKG